MCLILKYFGKMMESEISFSRCGKVSENYEIIHQV